MEIHEWDALFEIVVKSHKTFKQASLQQRDKLSVASLRVARHDGLCEVEWLTARIDRMHRLQIGAGDFFLPCASLIVVVSSIPSMGRGSFSSVLLFPTAKGFSSQATSLKCAQLINAIFRYFSCAVPSRAQSLPTS